MSSKEEERRKEKRFPVRTKITYKFESDDGGKDPDDSRETFTSDISSGGVGLYTECPADAGERITIIFDNSSKGPLNGEVRWCRRYKDDLYQLGIKID